MNIATYYEILADFSDDMDAGRLPNTTELDAWRSAVTSRSPNPPLDRTDSTSAHSGSVVTNDARLGGVGHEATVSGFTSLNSGGAGYSRPPAFSGKSQHG